MNELQRFLFTKPDFIDIYSELNTDSPISPAIFKAKEISELYVKKLLQSSITNYQRKINPKFYLSTNKTSFEILSSPVFQVKVRNQHELAEIEEYSIHSIMRITIFPRKKKNLNRIIKTNEFSIIKLRENQEYELNTLNISDIPKELNKNSIPFEKSTSTKNINLKNVQNSRNKILSKNLSINSNYNSFNNNIINSSNNPSQINANPRIILENQILSPINNIHNNNVNNNFKYNININKSTIQNSFFFDNHLSPDKESFQKKIFTELSVQKELQSNENCYFTEVKNPNISNDLAELNLILETNKSIVLKKSEDLIEKISRKFEKAFMKYEKKEIMIYQLVDLLKKEILLMKEFFINRKLIREQVFEGLGKINKGRELVLNYIFKWILQESVNGSGIHKNIPISLNKLDYMKTSFTTNIDSPILSRKSSKASVPNPNYDFKEKTQLSSSKQQTSYKLLNLPNLK